MLSVKKNAVYSIILTVSNLIFPIISFPYSARVLGPEGTGTVNFVLSFCQYFVISAALGIPIYGVREIAKVKESLIDRSKLFVELNVIRILASLLFLVPYVIVVLMVPKFKDQQLFYIWGAFVIVLGICSLEWFFGGMENFKNITQRSVLIKFVSLILLFVVVKKKTDVYAFLLLNVFTILLNSFFNVKYALNYVSLKGIKWNELELKRHIKPLSLIFSSTIAITVYTLLDTILLGIMVSDKSVGLYSAAMKIVKICVSIIASLSMVLVSRLSAGINEGKKDEIEKLLNHSFSFVYTIGIPMMVGIYILSPELVRVLSGNEFSEAILTMRILSPLVLIIGLANIFSTQILTSLAKDKLVMYASIFGALLSIILNLLLIPRFQENGSAVSNIIAETVVMTMTFFYSKKYLNFNTLPRLLFSNILISLLLFMVVYFVRLVFKNDFSIILFTAGVFFLLWSITQIFILRNTILLRLVNSIKLKL